MGVAEKLVVYAAAITLLVLGHRYGGDLGGAMESVGVFIAVMGR